VAESWHHSKNLLDTSLECYRYVNHSVPSSHVALLTYRSIMKQYVTTVNSDAMRAISMSGDD
jgi:hypothetical protein